MVKFEDVTATILRDRRFWIWDGAGEEERDSILILIKRISVIKFAALNLALFPPLANTAKYLVLAINKHLKVTKRFDFGIILKLFHALSDDM